MAEIRIERRRGPSLWPWVIGLVVLALLVWAIAELVNTDRDNKTMAAADEANGPAAPGAVAPSAAGAQPTGSSDAIRGVAPATEQPGVAALGELMPVGAQDIGQRVTAGGAVLSKPAHGGFWLKSDANAVLWAKSNLKVKPGQQIPELSGALEQASPGDVAAWLQDADVQEQAARQPQWQLITQLYLDTTVGSVAAAPDSAARRSGPGGRRATNAGAASTVVRVGRNAGRSR